MSVLPTFLRLHLHTHTSRQLKHFFRLILFPDPGGEIVKTDAVEDHSWLLSGKHSPEITKPIETSEQRNKSKSLEAMAPIKLQMISCRDICKQELKKNGERLLICRKLT